MRTYASFLIGLAMLTATAVVAPAAAPDWTQFRLTGNERSAGDVLGAIHAFDPSIDLSQRWDSELTVPAGMPVALDASGVLHPMPPVDAGPVYACAVVGTPFGYGPLNLVPPVPTAPPGCGGYAFQPGGISTLAEAVAGLYGLVVAHGTGAQGFGLAIIYCSPAGVGTIPSALPGLPVPVGCHATTIGSTLDTWTTWTGLQVGSLGASVGAAF